MILLLSILILMKVVELAALFFMVYVWVPIAKKTDLKLTIIDATASEIESQRSRVVEAIADLRIATDAARKVATDAQQLATEMAHKATTEIKQAVSEVPTKVVEKIQEGSGNHSGDSVFPTVKKPGTKSPKKE